MSEIKLSELKNICNEFAPIEVKINDTTVYQDEYFDNYEKALNRFNEIFTWNYLITKINIEIVHSHHSIINLYGEKYE